MTNLTSTGGVPGPGRIGRVAIGDLLKRAAVRFPDRIALTDGARRVTFTELEHDANRFANYLVKRGLKPGEKISTICNNSVEFVKALFGIHRAGRWNGDAPPPPLPDSVVDATSKRYLEAYRRVTGTELDI